MNQTQRATIQTQAVNTLPTGLAETVEPSRRRAMTGRFSQRTAGTLIASERSRRGGRPGGGDMELLVPLAALGLGWIGVVIVVILIIILVTRIL